MPIIYHDALIPIEENAILWRYIDLYKFKSLLENKSLFFCRDDKFSDPFEGSVPRREKENRPNDKRNENLSFLHKSERIRTVVNCWHINNYESDTMWRLYLKTNEGVALQSNPKRIKEAFYNIPEFLYTSKIRYIDYDYDIWYHPDDYPYRNLSSIQPLIHKRKEFSQENEFRIFHQIKGINQFSSEEYWANQPNNLGMFISVDVNILIEKVIFPPTLDIVGKNKIIKMVKTLGYNLEFDDSSLSNEPVF